MREKVISLAQDLIRRPSISPNDEGCQQIIAERLEKLGFQTVSEPFILASTPHVKMIFQK